MRGKRNPEFELLRITAMLMVMVLHALGHGGVLAQYSFGTVGYFFFWAIETLCYVGVNCFVLITGFFMINAKLKLSRIVKLIVQVEFYSILCTAVRYFVFRQPVEIEDMICTVFPLSRGAYWFVSSYIILLMLIPLVNRLIHSMTKKEAALTNIVFIILFCFVPDFFFWSGTRLNSGYIAWFIVLYFVAAYIRLYVWEDLTHKKIYAVLYIVFSLGAYAGRILIEVVTDIFSGIEISENMFYTYNSIFFFAASVCLFLALGQTRIGHDKCSNMICAIGSVSFGAYLWSDHTLIREPLWNTVNILGRGGSNVVKVSLCTVLAVIAVFSIGCIIEYIRLKIMHALNLKKFLQKCDLWVDAVRRKFSEVFD